MIHLDTSFLVDLLREQASRKAGAASAWLSAHADEALGASVFVSCELEAGAARAAHPQRERGRVGELMKTLAIAFPDERFAAVYGGLLSTLQARGRTIATMDLLIATSAMVEGVALLTGNRRHFDLVPDLRVLSHR